MTDRPLIDGCEPKPNRRMQLARDRAKLAEESEAVWTLVPEGRKIGRKGCLPLIAAAIKDIGYDAVFANTKAWAAQMARDGIERKHIMHPSTFFHPKKALYDGEWGDPEPERKSYPGESWENCMGCKKRLPLSELIDYRCKECKP